MLLAGCVQQDISINTGEMSTTHFTTVWFLFYSIKDVNVHTRVSLVSLPQAMSRSGLSGQSMDSHMDMSHLQIPKHMAAPQQDEPSDLEELEQFARTFKQRRIKLGFTQVKETRGRWTGECVSVSRLYF